MKKSLSDLLDKKETTEEAPKIKDFGAFKNVGNNQAQIDLNILRKYNVFFCNSLLWGYVNRSILFKYV